MQSHSTPQSSAANALSDAAREALRVSESRYRRLFEAAQDGILLLNSDTAQIEDINPYLIDMLGYSHAELLGKKLWEVGPFADIAQCKEMFAELQTNGYVRYKDLPLKTKAGAQIAVEFVSNIYDCEGIKVIQCNIRNILERKADHAKIQRHMQLYAALSQCNDAIVHCTSEEELFLKICRTAVQFGGMKMAWVGLIDPDRMVRPAACFGEGAAFLQDIDIRVDADSPFGQGPIGTSIRKNQPCWCQDFMNNPITAPWRERGARFGWGASASLPLYRNDIVSGAFVLYSSEANAFDELTRDLLIEMATNISFALDNFASDLQRKRAQEQIEFQNTILQTQQETSPDAILVVDENAQIISYNQQFIELWRLAPQIVSARLDAPVLQSVVAQVEDSEAFVARVQYLYQHPDDKSREEIRLKDGRILDRYSAPITGAHGKYYGRVWYFRDITERKRAEEALQQDKKEQKALIQKLEEAHNLMLQSEKMASIGQLAAGVAHEINNPIGFVYSNLGTLEKYVQDVFSMLNAYEQAEVEIANTDVRLQLQSARKSLDIVFLKDDLRALMEESRDGITRVKNIVQNLKDFSHVDAADEWRFSNLHVGINSTLNIVNNEIKYKAEVKKEYGDIPEVECLPSQLNQVFMNLLVNAAQAIEERGTITVRTGQQGDEVWVEVADTGKGISPEHRQKIFDPFFTTKRIGQGTGLGLSLSYTIIQKHHGRIEVQSEVGKGTTFRIWLPLRQPPLENV